MRAGMLFSMLLWFTSLPSLASSVEDSFQAKSLSVPSSEIAALPVLDRGRIKPLDSLARETLLFLTGKYSRWNLDPTQVYLGLTLHDLSRKLEILEIRDPRLREQLGFSVSKRLYSAEDIEGSRLAELARPLLLKQRQSEKSLDEHEKKVLEAVQQTRMLNETISGSHFLSRIRLSGEQSADVLTAAAAYLRAIGSQAPSAPAAARDTLLRVARSQQAPELVRGGMSTLALEVWYNRAHLFLWAAFAYFLIAFVLLTPLSRRVVASRALRSFLALPILIHAAGFAVRICITGFAPVTSMYGTMIWVALGIELCALTLLALYRNVTLVGVLTACSGILLLVAENIPLVISPDMDPIVAVLRSNFWLTIHVLTVTSSYAALSIAMLIGNSALVLRLAGRDREDVLASYAHAAYRMIQLGVFLLTAGIILGGIWADYSWGRFWGWDSKETWALIADLGFIAILHARYQRWIDEFGLLASSTFAYLLVVMAWYGVNFILATGLHSYGFSSGGTSMVIGFVALQLGLLGTVFVMRARVNKAEALPPSFDRLTS